MAATPINPSAPEATLRVALSADVHANLPALEAVLADAASHRANLIWNLGDFVGYGAFPEEVTARLRALGALSIRGNYDRKTLEVKEKGEQMRAKKSPFKWLAFSWAYEQLSRDSRNYLKALPEDRRLAISGWKVLMTHASPASRKEHLSPETPEERLRELTTCTSAKLILIGHSHRAFARQVDATWFVNPGSVGRPDDGDPRAAYAVLEFSPGELKIELLRIDYDAQRAAEAIRARGLPEAFARMTLLGRSLDWIKENDPGAAA
jgi:putative phosphoesterase